MNDMINAVINNSKDPNIWTGEEHSIFILRLSEAIIEILKAEEVKTKFNLNDETTEKIKVVVKKSINEISKLLANAQYSSLENTKIISKRNLDEIVNHLLNAKNYTERINEISYKLNNENQKLKNKINSADELLHWNNC